MRRNAANTGGHKTKKNGVEIVDLFDGRHLEWKFNSNEIRLYDKLTHCAFLN
jgi:hypothetical protein